jgi:O-acetyl-ADP-ribose deacetylase (regulator of RNase III)
MNKISGDLLKMAEQGHFDYIVHGANCFCTMKSGIAKQIVESYPAVREADSATKKGDREKLGTYTAASVESPSGQKFTVVNAYTQYSLARFPGDVVFDYDAFSAFLNSFSLDLKAVSECEARVIRVGFPYIGCGLAQGDEQKVVAMIENFSRSCGDCVETFLVRFCKTL